MSDQQRRIRDEVRGGTDYLTANVRQIAYWEQVNAQIGMLNALAGEGLITNDVYHEQLMEIAVDKIHLRVS